MKALLLRDKGLWKEMKVEECDTLVPVAGEILVEVHVVGLNLVDYKTTTGCNPNCDATYTLDTWKRLISLV